MNPLGSMSADESLDLFMRLMSGETDRNEEVDTSIKCPTCQSRYEKQDTRISTSSHTSSSSSPNLQQTLSHGAMKIFVQGACPICLEDKCGPPMVALPCGHPLCMDDFQNIGGSLTSNEETSSSAGSRNPRIDGTMAMTDMLMTLGLGGDIDDDDDDSDYRESEEEMSDDSDDDMPALEPMVLGNDSHSTPHDDDGSSDDDSVPPLVERGQIMSDSSDDDSSDLDFPPQRRNRGNCAPPRIGNEDDSEDENDVPGLGPIDMIPYPMENFVASESEYSSNEEDGDEDSSIPPLEPLVANMADSSNDDSDVPPLLNGHNSSDESDDDIPPLGHQHDSDSSGDESEEVVLVPQRQPCPEFRELMPGPTAEEIARADQARWRGFSARTIHHADKVETLEQGKQFRQRWGALVAAVSGAAVLELPNSWETLKRERFNMARILEDFEGDEETHEMLESAAAAALAEEDDDDNNDDEDETVDSIEDSSLGSPESPDLDFHLVQAADSIKFTQDVLKWLKFADGKYRDLFVKRIRQLVSGERSRILAKGLVGCKTSIYETYLEQKSGKRILWTPCTEEDGSSTILVWYVCNHKHVSRYMGLIDEAEKRSTRGLVSASSLLGRELTSGDSMTLGRNAILLDPMADSPLKLYQVLSNEVPWLEEGWEPPLRLTEDERVCVEKFGTVLLIGRSGTGKTICICNRMNFDRVQAQDRPLRQLFVARSRRLCSQVRDLVENSGDPYNNDISNKEASYMKFKDFRDECNRRLPPSEGDKPMLPGREVDFHRYKREFYREKIDGALNPLVIWTQIRSFIKGSIEAAQKNSPLGKDDYLQLAESRCRLKADQRLVAYAAFESYQRKLKEDDLWDDCDMAARIIRNYNRADSHSRHEAQYDKIYADEVQDFVQSELALFYLLCSQGGLFFAGDTAQSVVEGVTFRFEDLRMVAYSLYGGDRRYVPEKALKVKVNFRSHSGVLNVAAAVLERLYKTFPASFNKLEADEGYYLGPRPGVFKNVDNVSLRSLLERNDGLIVLTHDENTEELKKDIGGELGKFVLGIRDAKGLEFPDVIIVNFFCNLSSEHHKPWKTMLLNSERGDLLPGLPELEPQMKLLYTAITRCAKRLFFVETKKSIAGDAFVRWLTRGEKPLAESQDASKVEKMLTPDEWRSSGVDYANFAETNDSPTAAIAWIERAIRCFGRVDDTSLIRRAETHLESLHLRTALDKETDRLSDEREKQVAKLALACADERLVPELYQLVKTSLPLLGAYSRAKLQTLVLDKLDQYVD